MIREVIFLVAAFALQLASAESEPRLIDGFTYLGPVPATTRATKASYYYLSNLSANWADAFNSCNSMGGLLATPNNPVEDNALRTYMATAGGAIIWTGGRASGYVWKWETKNLNVAWSNFHSGTCASAANNCISAYSEGSKWAWCGRHCNNPLFYVCEF